MMGFAFAMAVFIPQRESNRFSYVVIGVWGLVFFSAALLHLLWL